jgi:hypothetical protein
MSKTIAFKNVKPATADDWVTGGPSADRENLPAQPTADRESVPAQPLRPKPAPKQEQTIQFSLSLRKSLRKQLASLAADADMTMRAFVLNALKAKGLSVRDEDLADLRRERR